MVEVVVIDSGVANLASVTAALRRIDVNAEVTTDLSKIRAASHVILPGVGAAAPAMQQLRDNKLVDVIRNLTQPVLGICLGMQLLFQRSEEGGNTENLGIIPATIKRMTSAPDRPVPHMGWNQIMFRKPGDPLLHGITDNSFVYFVHSFAAFDLDIALATTDYGASFAAIVKHKNFYGCQFHPERSSTVGSQILKNFVGLKS